MHSYANEYDVALNTAHGLYYNQLYRFAKSKITDAAESKIIVDAVFTEAFEKRKDFAAHEIIRPLLYGMVRNKCIDYLHDLKVKQRLLERFAYVQYTQNDEMNQFEQEEMTAEAELRYAVMLKELDQLPEKSRDILRTIFFGGISVRKYAESRGIAISSAHNLKNTALRSIGEKMRKKGVLRR
jgi:RNA polymerase sigma-70 factor (ECF subfamily)